MAKLLVDGGADVNVRDDSGVAPLAVAVACGHTDVLKVLLDHPDIDVDTQVYMYMYVCVYNLAIDLDSCCGHTSLTSVWSNKDGGPNEDFPLYRTFSADSYTTTVHLSHVYIHSLHTP